MTGSSREAIRSAACRMFAERGYAAVTVRDIAAEAGVSPALVIKLHGSKAELYAEAGPGDLRLAELGLPRESIGRALVLQVLKRMRRGEPEPWATLTSRLRDSPESGREVETARSAAIDGTAALIGDATPERRHAEAVVCQMIGLAEGLRLLGLFEGAGDDTVVAAFAPALQAQIDACGDS